MSMRKIYRQIAKKNHVSVQTVRREIDKAINATWRNSCKSREQEAAQNQVLCAGEIPTLEELVLHVKSKFPNESLKK